MNTTLDDAGLTNFHLNPMAGTLLGILATAGETRNVSLSGSSQETTTTTTSTTAEPLPAPTHL